MLHHIGSSIGVCPEPDNVPELPTTCWGGSVGGVSVLGSGGGWKVGPSGGGSDNVLFFALHVDILSGHVWWFSVFLFSSQLEPGVSHDVSLSCAGAILSSIDLRCFRNAVATLSSPGWSVWLPWRLAPALRNLSALRMVAWISSLAKDSQCSYTKTFSLPLIRQARRTKHSNTAWKLNVDRIQRYMCCCTEEPGDILTQLNHSTICLSAKSGENMSLHETLTSTMETQIKDKSQYDSIGLKEWKHWKHCKKQQKKVLQTAADTETQASILIYRENNCELWANLRGKPDILQCTFCWHVFSLVASLFTFQSFSDLLQHHTNRTLTWNSSELSCFA